MQVSEKEGEPKPLWNQDSKDCLWSQTLLRFSMSWASACPIWDWTQIYRLHGYLYLMEYRLHGNTWWNEDTSDACEVYYYVQHEYWNDRNLAMTVGMKLKTPGKKQPRCALSCLVKHFANNLFHMFLAQASHKKTRWPPVTHYVLSVLQVRMMT